MKKISATEATKIARARQTPENHRAAMKAHRSASLETENLTISAHHDRMAETHRKRARELTLQSARAACEHHTKMAETHERAAVKTSANGGK